MEKYFIAKGNDKKGPYSFEDLLKIELTDDYLIWKDGFDNWKPISEIEELKSHISIRPPATPIQLQKLKQKTVIINSVKSAAIWLPVSWLLIFMIMQGFAGDYALKNCYDSDEYPVFAEPFVIRRMVAIIALIISTIISIVITYFIYERDIKVNKSTAINTNDDLEKVRDKN